MVDILTQEEKLEKDDWDERISSAIEEIRQDILKVLDENDALIRQAEVILDSVPAEELDKALLLLNPHLASTAKPSANLITKIWSKIKWILTIQTPMSK